MSRKTKTIATNRQQVIVAGQVQDVYEPLKKATVALNVREHSLSFLHHLGTISTEQFLAGNEFRRHYEAAILGGFKAIDYSRVRVDGGMTSEPLTERVQRASKWLGGASGEPGIGRIGYSVLCRIAGEGETIRQVALTWPLNAGMSRQRMEGYIRGRLLEALDALIDYSGVIAKRG